MKKSLLLAMAASLLLCACGTTAGLGHSSDGQKYPDGIYGNTPSFRSRTETAVAHEESDALIEKTKGSTISFVIVFATPVNAMAPTKFIVAANIMACLGFSALVETAVAIALAVSWKPLMKSKASAAITISTVNSKTVSIYSLTPYAFFMIMVSKVFATVWQQSAIFSSSS